MPSSTSSSKTTADGGLAFERPGFVRLTASDRPGIAQPVPERHIPDRRWGRIQLLALLLFAALLGGWEIHWRNYGGTFCCRDSNGSWAAQRRRIDDGEGGALVLIGSSRTLFDIQLPVWQEATGERPIQLALEGTSPVPILEDLADDPKFTGRLVIGVAPELFFSGFAARADVIPYFHKERPSQRVGHWLSQHFIEPFFAFDSDDFALGKVIERQDWPLRPGTKRPNPIRRLAQSDADRNTQLWRKVETDAAYREMARGIWLDHLNGPPPPPMNTPEKVGAILSSEIGKAATAVAKLRQRGVKVVFLRLPSAGPYREWENRVYPRSQAWDRLLNETASPGIHFEDYPQMQGYILPEWSHLTHAEADRMTAAVAPLIEAAFAESGTPPRGTP